MLTSKDIGLFVLGFANIFIYMICGYAIVGIFTANNPITIIALLIVTAVAINWAPLFEKIHLSY